MEKINKLRINVIEKIKNSELFNKFDKKYILDSIKNIDFKVVDSADIPTENAVVACYINIDGLKKSKNVFVMGYNKMLTEPNKSDFIIISKDHINDLNLSSIITHEIYHYLDRLLGDKSSYSEKISLGDRLMDKKIKDKKYGVEKLSIIFGIDITKSSKNLEVLLRQLEGLYDIYSNYDIDYYASSSEIFARYKTLKEDMVERSIISNINQKIKLEDINAYVGYILTKSDIKQLDQSIALLFNIKLEFDELDKLI